MDIIEFFERKKGKEFWDLLNRSLFCILYTLFFIIFFIVPEFLFYLFITYGFIGTTYGWWYEKHKGEMERLRKGTKLIEAHITHSYKHGEDNKYYPTNFETIEKLSSDDANSVIDFVTALKQQQAQKSEKGIVRFKQKQIAYNESTDINTMNMEEKKKLDQEEKEEHDQWIKEYETINKQKKGE